MRKLNTAAFFHNRVIQCEKRPEHTHTQRERERERERGYITDLPVTFACNYRRAVTCRRGYWISGLEYGPIPRSPLA